MSTLFNRSTKLTVFEEGNAEGVQFENFRITFNVEKTLENNANTATISIFNLKDESVGLIENRNARAILESGYLGVERRIGGTVLQSPIIEILAIGDIDKVTTVRKGIDTITSFEIRDGGKALQESTIEKSFPPGSTTEQITNALVEAMGTVKGVIKGVTNETFSNGVSVSGKVRDVMKNMTDKMGLEFSVQDEELQIIPQGGDTGEEAIVVTPQTGLIGSPSRVVNKTTGTPEGVEFVALLNPRIRPGRRVSMESDFIQGVFTVQKVVFTGDNEEGNGNICKVQAK